MKKIDELLENNPENELSQKESKRRKFLKKAVYSAPVLLALGQLAKPTEAHADSGPPVGPPNWGGF